MKPKILIIDDETSLLSVLVDKFSQEGFEVSVAKDGQEGLNLALQVHPDMILLDIVMPVMDGMAMLKKLREDSWGKKAEVMLLTNLTDSTKIIESLHQDVTDYLIKSDWKLEDLVKKVSEKLAKKL